jgi:hypothetical protein
MATTSGLAEIHAAVDATANAEMASARARIATLRAALDAYEQVVLGATEWRVVAPLLAMLAGRADAGATRESLIAAGVLPTPGPGRWPPTEVDMRRVREAVVAAIDGLRSNLKA